MWSSIAVALMYSLSEFIDPRIHVYDDLMPAS